jgi:hypothetical protein
VAGNVARIEPFRNAGRRSEVPVAQAVHHALVVLPPAALFACLGMRRMTMFWHTH